MDQMAFCGLGPSGTETEMEGVDFVTKEHRIIFGLSDLKSFRFVCRKCKGGDYVSGLRRKELPDG